MSEARHKHQHFNKHRAEALSDAVFPIAMTVLVLDLKVPTVLVRGQLWAALQAESALWYSVVLTFAIASMFWMLQHRVFDALEAMTAQTMRLTILTLGFVTLLPFTTSLLGEAKGDPLAFELYFTNQVAIALSMALKLEVARIQGDLSPGSPARRTRHRVWSITLIMLSAVLSAHYLPLRRMWTVPVALGITARLIRKALAMRKGVKVADGASSPA